MPTHHEVKFWSNGIRMIAVFEKAEQADKFWAQLPRNGRVGAPRLTIVTSSHNLLKEFREIRKAPVIKDSLTTETKGQRE